MERDNDGVTVFDGANEPFDDVAVHVGCVALDSCRQVQDEWVVCSGGDNTHNCFTDFDSKIRLSQSKALRRVLIAQTCSWQHRLITATQASSIYSNVNNALFV